MNGIIIVNKASGMTSHDAVSRLRRILGEKRVGHAGTLDPMATGVLPVCVGKSTRLAEYIGDGVKTYIADICFGVETDSYDRQGNILRSVDCSYLSRGDIERALGSMRGDILQVPPMVSAIKMNGQPLYKLARAGQSVERQARAVSIYDLTIHSFTPGEHPRAVCEITCSKGTYIRSVAHDAGELLRCGAHLQELQRTRVGEFTLADAYTPESIEEMLAAGDRSFLLPPEAALRAMPALHVTEAQRRYALHGNSCAAEAEDMPLCAVYDAEGLIGIGHVESSVLFMDKVLREL